jgi:phage terminase large subunit-like protein
MGKKNGKTGLCSALALAHLVGPEVERRGQVAAAASDRDQSGLIFDELVAFIRDNPDFEARTNIQRHSKLIEDLVSGTKFRALSSDAGKAHGMSPSVIILDELAQWGTGPGRELYDALVTATGARAAPLTFIISTQTADEHSLMSELVDYGKQVNAGRITDPTFSAFVFEVPLDADPWDESLWTLANPALGDFRSLEEMRIFAERAKKMPTLAATFRNFYLNQRVQAESSWIPLDLWDACALEMGPEPTPLSGRRAFIGLDLSTTTDLTALVVLLPDADGYDIKAEFWCPADYIAERGRRDRGPYPLWAQQGHLHTIPGNIVDYTFIVKRIHELMAELDIVEVVVDPWNAKGFIAQLQQDGVPAVEVAQTMANLTSASKELEKLILGRKLHHDGHPVLRWNISNAVADVDGNGNVKPSKKRSPERIDGVSALVTALARALVAPTGSVYDTRPPILVDL